MDPKYVGKTVALPKETAANLERMRDELEKRLGFTPSLSQTVAYAVQAWFASTERARVVVYDGVYE